MTAGRRSRQFPNISQRMSWQSQLHAFLSLPVSCSRTKWATVYIIVSVAVHVLIFYATNRIFFTTPVVANIPKRFRPLLDDQEPPAKRVILFSIDGLRARVLFNNSVSAAPYLRDVVLRRGVWGVSRTQSPTLSRPGHLALASGVFEYMHGLTRSRHDTPFDSVFNRSTASWLFGEDEIVEMFADPRAGPKIHLWSYPPTLNDFSMGDPRQLDDITFNHWDTFLRNASQRALRRQSGLVFFNHLLGVDTYSHSHSASGPELPAVIAGVDAGIRRTEALVEAFFGHDRRTAYVVSSDHGMAEWSAHGAGSSEDETLTPFVAWGAGVRRARPTRDGGAWGIGVARTDIDQVDVCPLMAALLGLEVPMHSRGRLPLDAVNASAPSKVAMARAVALQSLALFRALRARVRAGVAAPLFSDFAPLAPRLLQDRLAAADRLAKAGKTAAALRAFETVRADAVEGLSFFHHYHDLLDRFLVAAVFLLLLLCFVASALPPADAPELPRVELAVFGAVAAAQPVWAAVEARSPLQLGFWLIAVYLAWALWRSRGRLRALAPSARGLAEAALLLGGLELLVLAFHTRWLISVAALVQAGVQTAAATPDARASPFLRLFLLASLGAAAFPLLPTVGAFASVGLVSVGALAAIAGAAGVLLLRTRAADGRPCRRAVLGLCAQFGMGLAAAAVHFRAHSSTRRGHGLPLGTISLTRGLLLATAAALAFAAATAPAAGVLLSVWLTVLLAFTLFSLAFETTFVAVLGTLLAAWVKLRREPARPVDLLFPADDERLALRADAALGRRALPHLFTYVVLVYLGCFGVGNFPSISSYDPHWVLCFQAVYDLAVMGVVMFLRNMLPVLLVTAPLFAVLHDVSFLQLYRAALACVDFIAIHFFLRLHHDHNALRHAEMVNHFAIAMAFVAMVSLCFVLARLLLTRRI